MLGRKGFGRTAIKLLFALQLTFASASAVDLEDEDLTETRYLPLYQEPDAAFAAGIPELQKCRILFVPGFLSNRIEDTGKILGRHFRFGQYFDEHVTFLRNSGIDAHKVAIYSEADPLVNAALISKAIEESPRPVILVTHSKGGIDTLETLIGSPGASQKVRGWIAIQTPFYGTPVADFVHSNKVLSPMAISALELLGGTRSALVSLTEAERREYNTRHAEEIAEVTRKFPVLSFSSWKASEFNPFDTPFMVTRNLMELAGVKSDGMIPLSSQKLPHTSFVSIPNTDHTLPVMYSYLSRFDRIQFTKAMLVILLERARHTQD